MTEQNLKVRIIKCSNTGWWYANKIGQVIEVVRRYFLLSPDEEKNSYLVKGGIGIIMKSDCEIIEN